MKIDIELTKKQCMDILCANNYVCDDVTLYYTFNVNPYNSNVPNPEDLRAVNTKVAYEKDNKPEFLNSEYPMLEDAEEFIFDKVINRLISQMFINSILGNFNK